MNRMTDWAKPRQRIAKLLTTWPELTHTFAFATGAIYALERADQRAMRDRRSYQDVDRLTHTQIVRDVLQALDSAQEPAESWIAGFLYNSAVMRLDACYERFLEAITRELKQRGQLAASVVSGVRLSDTEKSARQIESSFSPPISLTRVHLEQNRSDVNRLKHRLFGREAADERSRALGDVESTSAALDELLTILETPEIQHSLRGAYQGLPPA
jgi:hypothetical protein